MSVSGSATADADTPDLRDLANRQRLERFLPRDEALIWSASPQLSRLLQRALYRTGVMAVIASAGLYFAWHGINETDFCGPEATKTCRKLYIWPWIGLVAAAAYLPFLWLGLLAHASGLLREFYGLTERQALRLRANPFDSLQSVKLASLRDDQIAMRKRFGTFAFGSVAFLCLSDKDAEALHETCGKTHRVEQSPLKALVRDGTTR